MTSDFVEQPAFVARMTPTVNALNQLCAAIETAGARHGNMPAVLERSEAMDEIEKEKQLRKTTDEWEDPVRAAHWWRLH